MAFSNVPCVTYPSSLSFSMYCLPPHFPINPHLHFSHFQPYSTHVIVSSSLELWPPPPSPVRPPRSLLTFLASVITINVINYPWLGRRQTLEERPGLSLSWTSIIVNWILDTYPYNHRSKTLLFTADIQPRDPQLLPKQRTADHGMPNSN